MKVIICIISCFLFVSCGEHDGGSFNQDNILGFWACVHKSTYYTEWEFSKDSVAVQKANREIYKKKYHFKDRCIYIDNNKYDVIVEGCGVVILKNHSETLKLEKLNFSNYKIDPQHPLAYEYRSSYFLYKEGAKIHIEMIRE